MDRCLELHRLTLKMCHWVSRVAALRFRRRPRRPAFRVGLRFREPDPPVFELFFRFLRRSASPPRFAIFFPFPCRPDPPLLPLLVLPALPADFDFPIFLLKEKKGNFFSEIGIALRHNLRLGLQLLGWL